MGTGLRSKVTGKRRPITDSATSWCGQTARPSSGDQVARWRLVGDSLWITLGDGVWEVYGLRISGDQLTISGGDLKKPVTLRRVGPPPARPDTLAIPPSPP